MYKSDEKGDRYECDNCGAQLPAPEPSGTRTCSYCGSVFATKQDSSVPGGYTFIVQSPPTIDISQYYNPDAIASATKTASRAGCIMSIVIALVVLGATAIPIYFAVQDGGFGDFGFGDVTGQSYRVNATSGIILPSEPSTLEVAVRADPWGGGAGQASVFGIGGSGLTEQWKSSQLDDPTYNLPMVADTNAVYVLDGKRIIAFRRSDGGQLWQGSISDTAPGDCSGCLMLLGDRLVARSSDGRLQAFAIADGKPAWQRDLPQTSATTVQVGAQLVIVDGEPADARLVVVNAVDGTDLHVLDAQCSDGRSSDKVSTNATIHPSPDDNTFVIGFGTIPSCLQRWDAATGALIWTQTLDSGTSFNTFHDVPAAWSPALVAIPSDRELRIVDRNTGLVVGTVVGDSEGFWPLGFTENELVTLVEDQRGTTDYFVRGLNTTSWAPAFNTPLLGTPTQWTSSPTVSSSDTVVAIGLSGTTVRIITFAGDDQDFVVQSVDATTGTASAETTLPGFNATIASFGVIGWVQDTAVLVAADTLVTIDTANPTAKTTWN